MLEIFIEGQKLDVNAEFSMLLSYAIDDVKDFGAKNTTFSKTVILPGTKNNNQLFGNIFDVSVSNDYNPNAKNVGINFNASVNASVVVFNNNIQCVKGVLQLLEVVYDDSFIEYEVGIFGELAGFAAKLGSRLLSGNMNTNGTPNTALDLDFSAYNQNYTLANIVGSKSNIGIGSGVVYPLIDYGTYGRNATHTAFGKHSWMYKTFRPALHVKEYWDKIFQGTGYTYDCPLVNTARFKGLIMPLNQKELTRLGGDKLNISIPIPYTYSPKGPEKFFPLHFNTLTTLGGFTPSLGNTKFTYSGSDFIGNFYVKLKISFAGLYGYNNRVSVYKNDYLLLASALLSRTTGIEAFGESTTINLSVQNGDYLTIVFEIDGNTPSQSDDEDLTISEGQLIISGSSVEKNPINIGEPIPINDTIPSNILQKDFISSICKLFNLYIYEDPQKDKHLKIKPYVDFFNLSTSIDWTYKLDRSKPIKIKPMSELTARYYQFDYKKDSDYWNDIYNKRYNLTYGSYKYDSNYQLSEESQKVEIIFSGTPIVGYQGEDKVYSSIFKRTGTDSAPVEETVDSNIRILQTKLVTGVASWDILASDGTTVLGSYTDYPYAGHFDDPDAPSNDLNYGVPQELFFTLLAGSINVNQFNLYWSSYLAEITDKDAKLLTATFKLALKDINNLDFSKYIYIDGSLFRINKIIDFNATNEDTCSVELIKIINKIY